MVLGGGIGGLSAAHELSERGFSVRVLELRGDPRWQGPQRGGSEHGAPPERRRRQPRQSCRPTRRDLPGEHGFPLFFPRFYRHVIDTMARIPYRGSRSVAENLVDTTGTVFARFGRRPLKLPTIIPSNVTELFTLVSDLGPWFGPELGIPPEDVAFFGERIWQILTSCSERRLNEYEKIGWWDFVGAGQRWNLPEILWDWPHPLACRGPGEASEHQDDRRHVRAVLLRSSPSQISAPTEC